MNEAQMMAELAKLPDPELLQASKLTDPVGADVFYCGRTVVKLLDAQRRQLKAEAANAQPAPAPGASGEPPWSDADKARLSVALGEVFGWTPPQPEPAAPAVPHGWQPMETAPLDGSNVLVLLDCAGVGVVHLAWYRGPAEWEESGQYLGGWADLQAWLGWWSYTRNSVGQERLEGVQAPKFWMPLAPLPDGISV